MLTLLSHDLHGARLPAKNSWHGLYCWAEYLLSRIPCGALALVVFLWRKHRDQFCALTLSGPWADRALFLEWRSGT